MEATIFRSKAVRAAPVLAALLLGAACSANADTDPVVEDAADQAAQPRLGLMSTLPIYWNEAVEFSDLLDQGEGANWVRAALERDYALEPLDVLSPEALAPLDLLMLAQPRALSAAENVALDDWVREGGRLVLFADPMLTRHSEYRLGDPRRPHDVALLSPILARWGLAMEFDTSQPQEERALDAFDMALPVDLAGTLHAREGGEADCTIAATGIAARCTIGAGRALVIADAALLDEGHADEGDGVEGEGAGAQPDMSGRQAALDAVLRAGLGT